MEELLPWPEQPEKIAKKEFVYIPAKVQAAIRLKISLRNSRTS